MKIYKKDSKGKIRILDVYHIDDTLYQLSGLIDGKKVINSKLCKPKNVGKSNATTAEEQANIEKQAIITKKLQEGYFSSIKEAQNNQIILPMLAKEYNKEKHKIDWNSNVFVQPKLDGMRALGTNMTLISRKNRSIDTMGHICSELGISETIDGELYAHGLSFQENMKLIKKYRKGESEKVIYHVYDLIDDSPFIDRYEHLRQIVCNIDIIELVPTYQIVNEKQLKEFHEQFLIEGYEGTIIRHGNAKYEVNKRSSSLLKYKDFKDMTATIIDIIPMNAYPNQGLVVCNGFKATPKMSHKEKEELLINKQKYIGQTAEIRYFEETDEGFPRFPVCVGFRLDK